MPTQDVSSIIQLGLLFGALALVIAGICYMAITQPYPPDTATRPAAAHGHESGPDGVGTGLPGIDPAGANPLGGIDPGGVGGGIGF